MAIPGLVQAVASASGYLIDGGVVNPLPYNHLRGLADIVVAVDLGGAVPAKTSRKAPPSPAETLVIASQMIVNNLTARMARDDPPDVHIAPAVHHFMGTDIFKSRRIFEAGDACREEFAALLEAAFAAARRQRLA